MKHLFLSGSHKSGTSWLSYLINDHPAVMMTQELWLLGDPLSLAGGLRKGLDSWTDLPTVRDNMVTEEMRAATFDAVLRAAISAAMTRGKHLDGIRLLGDKSPALYSLEYQRVYDLFPDGFFLQMVRDPRDVILSHHYHAYRLEEWDFFGDPNGAKDRHPLVMAGEDLGPNLLDAAAVERMAGNWAEIQACGFRAAELFGQRFMWCPFEQLVEDARTMLRAVMAFIEEPVPDEQIAATVESYTFEKLADGRRPGQADPSHFFRKGIVGDWNGHYDDTLIDIVERSCGTVARRLGYPVP